MVKFHSFKTKKNALKHAKSLREKGYSARVIKTPKTVRDWSYPHLNWQVRVEKRRR